MLKQNPMCPLSFRNITKGIRKQKEMLGMEIKIHLISHGYNLEEKRGMRRQQGQKGHQQLTLAQGRQEVSWQSGREAVEKVFRRVRPL